MTDKQKRLVRELQALRSCSFTEALTELRELGSASWRAYIDRVRAIVIELQARRPQP